MQQQFLQSISIHALCAGSDIWTTSTRRTMPHFNPRSPCGERPLIARCTVPENHFNPRSPCGERRVGWFCEGLDWRFQSTLPVRGATVPPPLQADPPTLGISIHAPRAGSDKASLLPSVNTGYFNPRSPCGERPRTERSRRAASLFQSTLPVRGATVCDGEKEEKTLFQSTLPVRGATVCDGEKEEKTLFQSTLPVRGATTMRPRS